MATKGLNFFKNQLSTLKFTFIVKKHGCTTSVFGVIFFSVVESSTNVEKFLILREYGGYN